MAVAAPIAATKHLLLLLLLLLMLLPLTVPLVALLVLLALMVLYWPSPAFAGCTDTRRPRCGVPLLLLLLLLLWYCYEARCGSAGPLRGDP